VHHLKRILPKNGSRVNVLIGAAKLGTNDAMHGVAYIADITTRKKAEGEVITALEEKITYWNALLKLLYPLIPSGAILI
jgi:hypothetical protein